MTTNKPLPPALERLVEITQARRPLGQEAPKGAWVRDAMAGGDAMYRNENAKLGIDFSVERLAFPEIQTMDPRVVRIPPGKNNEFHKHAHESLFVILQGEGEVRVGDDLVAVKAGSIAFVPRWIFHQTRNTSTTEDLVVLAVTDFGFTAAVLGDYDKRMRLAAGGPDAKP